MIFYFLMFKMTFNIFFLDSNLKIGLRNRYLTNIKTNSIYLSKNISQSDMELDIFNFLGRVLTKIYPNLIPLNEYNC